MFRHLHSQGDQSGDIRSARVAGLATSRRSWGKENDLEVANSAWWIWWKQ